MKRRQRGTASASLEIAIRGKSWLTYRKALKNRFGRVRAAGFSAIRQSVRSTLDTALAGVKLSRVQAAELR